MACSLSYSTQHYYENGKYPGTKKYLNAFNKAVKTIKKAENKQSFTKGRSCCSGVFTSVRSSGYDTNYPHIRVQQAAYLGFKTHKAKTKRWTYIGDYKTNNPSDSGLQPGDVLIGSTHTLMYVGKNIPKEVYKNKLKGTDADTGTPYGTWVSAHFGGDLKSEVNAALCICSGSWSYADSSRKYEIYRCVLPSDSKYRAGKIVK